MSDHQIYLVDSTQRVRPMDVSAETLRELELSCRVTHRWYPLTSQMRVRAGEDYVGYVRDVLSQRRTAPATFAHYDLRFFDDIHALVEQIREQDQAAGLARLLAGYAWEWRSKHDKTAYDIRIDDVALQWNQTDVDWINSPGSANEVGSIHTIQGYDLNYAGVIIGRDLRLDPASGRIVFDRTNYFDRKGKENLKDHKFSDDELLAFVRNIYSVLLTRGMLGTYVYVCDEPLREYLRRFFS